MEKRNFRPRDRSPAAGDLAVAALLAIGAAIERGRATRNHRSLGAAVPVILVNTVAFLGQLTYWRTYLPSPAEQVLVAGTLESVAVYLAWQAHLARKADDSALRLQLGAYLVAAGVGVMNYSHFCQPDWRPTVAAVTFGGASAISPWLWGVHSRRESRDDLKARGLIEDHAVRLGPTRWFWHFIRCVHVTWLATWIAENRPSVAITLIKRDTGTEDGHGTGQAVVSGAVAEVSPPALSSTGREPRRAVSVRAARTAGLAVAQEVRAQVVLDLLAMPFLPSARTLVTTDARLNNSRRTAEGILREVRAKRNGADRGDGDGS